MPWNGAGTFNLDPAFSPEINGTVIDAVRYNGLTTDIASGITVALTKNGQNAATANIPFGGFKLTGLGPATAAGDATNFEQTYIRGEANIATAATCSIFSLSETTLNLTGVTTVTSFGAGTAGDLKYCTAVAAFQITYDAVNLITPGLTNLSIAAGDWFMVKSKGGSASEVVQITRRASLTTRLSDLGAAAAVNTIANGLYAQTWGWAHGGVDPAGTECLKLTQTTATGNQGHLLTLEGGGASLFRIISNQFASSMFTVTPSFITIGGNTQTVAGNAGNVTVAAFTAGLGSNGNGGSLSLSAGNADGLGTHGTTNIYGPTAGASVAALTFSNTAALLNGTGKLVLDIQRVVFDNSNGAPTITAGGGAGATIAGSDIAFEVIAGTGSPTSFTVTFADARALAPQICLCSTSQAGCTLNYTVTTTTVQIQTSLAWASGAKISVVLLELQ